MRKIILLIMLSLGCALTSNAQPNPGVTDAIRTAITDRINGLFGKGMYDPNTVDIVNVDSSMTPNEPLGIQDPYQTLEHCYVFLAAGKRQNDGSFPKGFIGVYKNGNIIWHSPAIINRAGVVDAEIDPILDMNKSGEVDIVTQWLWGQGEADYIWIFSWDGNDGKPLNLYDSAGHSNILSYTDEVNFVDLKGDGKLEIEGKWKTNAIPAQEISVLYAWNGQNYVNVDTSSFGSGVIPPRNRVQAVVHAKVVKANDSLNFSYVVENKKSSLQKIETLAISRGTKSIGFVHGPSEWEFDVWTKQPLVSWDDAFLYNLLPQGQKDTFEFSSTALPKIGPFYIQGNNATGTLSDIFTNALHGYTLIPVDPPLPFVPIDFLDTLISYKDQCVTLGWLRNDRSREQECEETMRSKDWYVKEEVGKMGRWEVNDSWDFDRDWNSGLVGILDGRLDMAKRMLTKGDSVQARRDLQIFVMEVELVYRLGENQEARSQKSDIRGQKPVMSSEAYALLKYNAEYLIDRLPEKHSEGRGGGRWYKR